MYHSIHTLQHSAPSKVYALPLPSYISCDTAYISAPVLLVYITVLCYKDVKIYSEASLIRHPLGLENDVGLRCCRIREVICIEKVHACANIWCQFERLSV